MDVTRVEDVAAYSQLVAPVLGRAPARHNLILGILDVVRRRPDSYQGFRLWAVRNGGVVAAAVQTPPYNLVVAEPLDMAALEPLAASILREGVRLPGVVGGVAEAEAFASAWVSRAGGDTQAITRQGIYELTAVRDRGNADGGPPLIDASERRVALCLEVVRRLRDCAEGDRKSVV